MASAVLLALVAGAPVAGAQAPQDPNTVRVLSTTYADGRTVRYPVRDNGGGSWTAVFPRVPGAETVNEGLELSALDVAYTLDGRDVVVTVALRYGTPHQQRVPVTTVRLNGERSARVDELTAFGVRPITFAIETLPRPQLAIPAVVLPSSLLEAVVDVDSAGAPRYLITITNHAQQGVMALAFQAYRGEVKAMAGKPHTPGHTPQIAPGETYRMTLTPSASVRPTNSGDVWNSIDRIEFTSVTWSDGIVEGSERPAVETRVVDAGTARLLARALALMRAAQAGGSPDLRQLRSAVASLSIDDVDAARAAASDPNGVNYATATSLTRIGTQIAKDALLNDFDEVLREQGAADPAACRTWLASAVAKFDGWRMRIVMAPR